MGRNRIAPGLLLLAAVGLQLAFASPAEAALIRIDMVGVVTNVRAGDSVALGDSVFGSIVYDASAEWTSIAFSPSQANFNGAIVDFEISGHHIDSQSSNIIHTVHWDGSRQTLGFGQSGFDGGFLTQLDVTFEGPNLFDSFTELPDSFDFGEVTGAEFKYALLDSGGSPLVHVDSYSGTIQSVQLTVVPEPSTAVILGLGIAWLGLVRRGAGGA
jgi:hypothetical protein